LALTQGAGANALSASPLVALSGTGTKQYDPDHWSLLRALYRGPSRRLSYAGPNRAFARDFTASARPPVAGAAPGGAWTGSKIAGGHQGVSERRKNTHSHRHRGRCKADEVWGGRLLRDVSLAAATTRPADHRQRGVWRAGERAVEADRAVCASRGNTAATAETLCTDGFPNIRPGCPWIIE